MREMYPESNESSCVLAFAKLGSDLLEASARSSSDVEKTRFLLLDLHTADTNLHKKNYENLLSDSRKMAWTQNSRKSTETFKKYIGESLVNLLIVIILKFQMISLHRWYHK